MVVDRFSPATTDYSQPVQGKSLSVNSAANSVGSTQAAQTTEDTTTFSSSTNSIQALAKAAVQISPTRQVKVEALRQAVNSAEYQLDSAKIAQSIANSI